MAGRRRDRPGRTADDEPSTVVDASLDGALEALREELEAENRMPVRSSEDSEDPTMLVRLPGQSELAEPVISTPRRRLDPGEAIDADPTRVRSRASLLPSAPSNDGSDHEPADLEVALTQSVEVPGAGPPLVRVHRFEAPIGARLDPPSRRLDDAACRPVLEEHASDQLDPTCGPDGPDDTAFHGLPEMEVSSRPHLEPATSSVDTEAASCPDVDARDRLTPEARSRTDDTAEEPVSDAAFPGRSLGSAQPSAADYPDEVLLASEEEAPEPKPAPLEPDPPAPSATPAPLGRETSSFDPGPRPPARPLFALDGADSGRAVARADREPTRGARRPENARSVPDPTGPSRLTPPPEVLTPGDLARRVQSPRRPPRPRAAPGPARQFDPEGVRGLARTSDALARIIPAVLAGIVLLATGLVFFRVFGERAGATPHVRLELLGVPGRLPPRPDPVRTAQLIIETEPPGLVVFHDKQILGKTPCEATLPFAMPTTVGVRLVGPRFEEWVDQIDASVSGEFVVRAKLTER